MISQPFYLFGITIYSGYIPETKSAWFWPDKSTFDELSDYFGLGIASSFMCFLEFFVQEVIVIYAGLRGVAELNASGILANFAYMLWGLPFGLQLAICVLVGNSLG